MNNSILPNERLQHLVELAQNITFDPHKPLRYYIILVNELQQRGKKAILDKRFEEAFVTLVRMLLVIISYIPKHPDYPIIDQSICKDLETVKERYFSITSQIKQLLRKKYQNDYDTVNEVSRNKLIMKSINSLKNDASNSEKSVQDCVDLLDFSYKPPPVNKNLKQPFTPTNNKDYYHSKPLVANSYNKINSKLSNVPHFSYKELLDDFNSFQVDKYQKQMDSSTYNNDIKVQKNLPTTISNELVKSNDSFSSSLPSLEDFSSSSSRNSSLNSSSIQLDPLNDYLVKNKTIDVPSFDRSLKPEYSKIYIVTNSNNSSLLDDSNSCSNNIVNTTTIFEDKTSSTNENGGALLTVIIPENTADRFAVVAHADIRNNIETLGILAGVLLNNTYILTHILIPEQSGTPDSCEMLGENEIFLYQIENNLLTLGWIHTHPTQSCFLSSVDLHTHFSYQCQLKEAIAIVLSHKNRRFTNYAFHLTARGMETIKNCHSRGFHPHDNNLFEVCEYVVTDHKRSINIVDMRVSNSSYL